MEWTYGRCRAEQPRATVPYESATSLRSTGRGKTKSMSKRSGGARGGLRRLALGELQSPSVKAAFATHKHFRTHTTYTVVSLVALHWTAASTCHLPPTSTFRIPTVPGKLYSRPEPFRVWWSGVQPRMAGSPPYFVASCVDV